MRFPARNKSNRLGPWCRLCPRVNLECGGASLTPRSRRSRAALEKHERPIPKAVLRSLHDVDGDFELQAPAAGGSNGVLVPPWLYEGTIAVTSEAQSPFGNLYSRGKVGVSVPEAPRSYRIEQAIYPVRTPETCRLLHVNLDFRIAPPRAGTTGQHRFWIGAGPNSPAVELLISASAVELRSSGNDRAARDRAGQRVA